MSHLLHETTKTVCFISLPVNWLLFFMIDLEGEKIWQTVSSAALRSNPSIREIMSCVDQWEACFTELHPEQASVQVQRGLCSLNTWSRLKHG